MPQEHSDTPPPRRFVLQKRQAGTTPHAQSSAPRPGAVQFQATPRFGFLSSTTPKPPVPSASAFPPRTIRPTQPSDPIYDSFSPSPPPVSPALPDTQDTIQIESPVPCSQVEVVAETPVGGERPSKRRRLSISSHDSSLDLASPSADRQRPLLDTFKPEPEDAYDVSLESDSDEGDVSQMQALDAAQDDLELVQRTRRTAPITGRETGIRFRAELAPKSTTGATVFQPAPRFVQMEKVENPSGTDDHHKVFSPPRRGEKYVRGGLAAELGHWITNSLTNSGGSKTFLVSDSCHGGDMQLVRGHVAQQKCGSTGGPETMDVVENEDHKLRGPEVRMILGGEGRTDGKVEHVTLEAGSSVVISPPVWDIDVGEHRWRVAYNWRVKPQ